METVTVSGSGSAARLAAIAWSSRCHALGPMRTSCVALLAGQEHRVLERAARGEREVRLELRVEPVRLVVGHRQESERPDELV